MGCCVVLIKVQQYTVHRIINNLQIGMNEIKMNDFEFLVKTTKLEVKSK